MADLASILWALKTRDRSKDKKPHSYEVVYQKVSVIQHVLSTVNLLLNSQTIVPSSAYHDLLLLKHFFHLRSVEQASLLVMLMNISDNHRIRLHDLAKQYDVPTLAIIDQITELDDLVKREVIVRRRDPDGCSYYLITEPALRSLRQGELPATRNITGLSTMQFYDEVDSLLRRYRRDELDDEGLKASIIQLVDCNKKLAPVQYLRHLHLTYEDLLLALVMAIMYLNDNDDQVSRHDLNTYFEHMDLTVVCFELENGTHELMRAGLVEYSCADGQADPSRWKLSGKAKSTLLGEIKVITAQQNSLLSRHQDIVPRRLFFNDRISAQVDVLKNLLKYRRFRQVQKALAGRGMRKGFACLFYGAPGTGKTETVLQLARETKRDIMLVDVPSIRSKWVGQTEKNVEAIFDRYRGLVKDCKQAPILLFNEADALFGMRKAGAENSVDKMENAMQNIFLQEIEQLDGILIATTNLCCNLDSAFERRFLYKIEFEKPSPQERQHIWRAMLPDLTKPQALELANQFDFSGGQIENIARKRVVSDILANRKSIDLPSVMADCRAESLNKTNRKAIGFSNK